MTNNLESARDGDYGFDGQEVYMKSFNDDNIDHKDMNTERIPNASLSPLSTSTSSVPTIDHRRRAAAVKVLPTQHDVQMSPLPTPRNKKLQRKLQRAARRREQKRKEKEQLQTWFVNLVYGMINAVIVLPVLISFGKIIYQDSFFQPYIPTLIRLTTMSGIVHQIMFSTFSSLPFAIGQVQDAGLIFLSKIAGNVVTYCESIDCTPEQILATTTIGLAVCTAMLGLGLIIVGKLKVASYVQNLPTAVVGGYLAYIGYFCGIGGIRIMAASTGGDTDISFSLFQHEKTLTLVLPGIFGGVGIFVLVRAVRHMAVLPCCIISILASFYAILAFTGTSFKEAKELGWISQSDNPPVWYHMWDFLSVENVVWYALLQTSQITTWLAMTFVVALSSSLDVAAIELELGRKLDYNHEIKTVGFSNLISGITGGYTGSYIFSQSIFSLRAGIRSRMTGYTVAIIELLSVISPIVITSYIPNFFFGSLLIMICVDLMVEWLWEVRSKVTKAEYLVAISTFILIHFTSVEYGIILGSFLFAVFYMVGIDVGVETGSGISPASSNTSMNSLSSLNHLDTLDEAEHEQSEIASRYGTMNYEEAVWDV